MAPLRVPSIALISLGNPAPYLNTFHSAGHHALAALQPMLPDQPPLESQSFGAKKALASIGPEYALLQCPTLMNLSGHWVNTAITDLLRSLEQKAMTFIIVHDELEQDLGIVKFRPWERSARGHNGIKSCKNFVKTEDRFADSVFGRLNVGIGRPSDRKNTVVADYVLREMNKFERAAVGEKAATYMKRWLEDLVAEKKKLAEREARDQRIKEAKARTKQRNDEREEAKIAEEDALAEKELESLKRQEEALERKKRRGEGGREDMGTMYRS